MHLVLGVVRQPAPREVRHVPFDTRRGELLRPHVGVIGQEVGQEAAESALVRLRVAGASPRASFAAKKLSRPRASGQSGQSRFAKAARPLTRALPEATTRAEARPKAHGVHGPAEDGAELVEDLFDTAGSKRCTRPRDEELLMRLTAAGLEVQAELDDAGARDRRQLRLQLNGSALEVDVADAETDQLVRPETG